MRNRPSIFIFYEPDQAKFLISPFVIVGAAFAVRIGIARRARHAPQYQHSAILTVLERIGIFVVRIRNGKGVKLFWEMHPAGAGIDHGAGSATGTATPCSNHISAPKIDTTPQ